MPVHPTREAVREYARLEIVLEGELQCHLNACEVCAALYRAEVESTAETPKKPDPDAPTAPAATPPSAGQIIWAILRPDGARGPQVR